jgi:hypothetical protein
MRRRRRSKITFFDQGQTRDFLNTFRAANPTGRWMPPEEIVFASLDGEPIDYAAQPRAKTCGVCGSSSVTNYATILFPSTLGEHAGDPAAVAAMVLGVCGTCEALGPDVFLPAMERRLVAEGQERFDHAEELAAAEMERRGLKPDRDETGRIRGVESPAGYKQVEVAVLGPDDKGVFRNGTMRPGVDVVIFTDCAGRFWLATADEVRAETP